MYRYLRRHARKLASKPALLMICSNQWPVIHLQCTQHTSSRAKSRIHAFVATIITSSAIYRILFCLVQSCPIRRLPHMLPKTVMPRARASHAVSLQSGCRQNPQERPVSPSPKVQYPKSLKNQSNNSPSTTSHKCDWSARNRFPSRCA